jgi:endonuclease YncB( thermonuclease family)
MAISAFLCLAIALHDVDGPIHCRSGDKIRLQGIGATETDGSCRPNQPCVPGDPIAQRRRMARAMGATIAREDRSRYGQAWFSRPVALRCVPTGRSHKRVTAWCTLPDGRDLSCLAIRSGVAVRWERYDRGRRLTGCRPA